MNANNSRTAWVVGKHALDRHAYRSLIARDSDFLVLGDGDYSAANIMEAIERHPGVFVFITGFPTPMVRILLRSIHHLRRSKSLVVINVNYNRQLLSAWARTPIDGLLTHDSSGEEFAAALRAIENQQRPYYADHIKTLLTRELDNGSALDKLSPREAELLPLLGRGLTLQKAACEMAIAYKTADSYRSSLLKKLKLHDRVELALYAASEGVIDI